MKKKNVFKMTKILFFRVKIHFIKIKNFQKTDKKPKIK
jgi:hypothetical protein